ncbi:hypothetical protein JD844_005521 [Phrynosoma platyrhinos]|uniref:Uncharacterized protein n=1 Tax=Phrynosoma platyrhinos TaxID=52577 RepID=A0ABQ7TN90_PHRPL|nr:hypothetical protein JD844_005521 [Phrynosoma platyrhinos]
MRRRLPGYVNSTKLRIPQALASPFSKRANRRRGRGEKGHNIKGRTGTAFFLLRRTSQASWREAAGVYCVQSVAILSRSRRGLGFGSGCRTPRVPLSVFGVNCNPMWVGSARFVRLQCRWVCAEEGVQCGRLGSRREPSAGPCGLTSSKSPNGVVMQSGEIPLLKGILKWKKQLIYLG